MSSPEGSDYEGLSDISQANSVSDTGKQSTSDHESFGIPPVTSPVTAQSDRDLSEGPSESRPRTLDKHPGSFIFTSPVNNKVSLTSKEAARSSTTREPIKQPKYNEKVVKEMDPLFVNLDYNTFMGLLPPDTKNLSALEQGQAGGFEELSAKECKRESHMYSILVSGVVRI